MAMNEELKIKVSVETDGAVKGVKDLKDGLKNLGGGAESTEQVQAALVGLKDTMESIRNMQFFDLFVENLDGIRTWASGFKRSITDTGVAAKDVFGGVWDALLGRGIEDGDTYWSHFNKELKTAKENADYTTAGIKTAFTKMGSGIKAALTSTITQLAAVIAEIAILYAGVKHALTIAPQIKNLRFEANTLGLSLSEYQKWAYVLESVGEGTDDLADAIKTLSSEQSILAEGSAGNAAAFKELGYSVEDVLRMTQEELFINTVEGLQKVEDSVRKTQLAYQIFGEDTAARLTNILYMNNEEMRKLIDNYYLLGGVASQDLNEKSDRLSMSLQNMRQAWTGLSNAIAEIFMPTITAVVRWLTKAIAIVRMFIQALFGLDRTPASGDNNSLSAGMGDYAKSVDNATKSVQKLKREALGFDELNKLPGKDSSSSSGAGSTAGYGGAGFGGGAGLGISTEDLGLGKIQSWFDKYKNIIQDIATWSLIGIGAIGAVLCFMGGNWLGGIAFLGLLGTGIAAGSVEGGSFERLGNKLKGWYDGIKNWFNTNVKPVFTKEFWSVMWDVVKTAFSVKLAEIKDHIAAKVYPIKEWFKTNVKPFFTKTYWFNLFENIRYSLAYKLDLVKQNVADKWKVIKDWFDKNIKPKFTKTYWFEKFENIRYSLAYKLDQAKTAVADKWKGIKDWFSKNIAPKFTKTYWFNKFDTIKSGAKSAFNGVISVVEKAVNGIIKKINTLSWSIPNWVPVYGGKKFGFNFKEIAIPRLATGGIAVRSTLANIGENGAEAVLPLERNTGWMDTLADKIAARGGGASKIVLMVDGKELGWASINGINSITKQTGNLQLQLV